MDLKIIPGQLLSQINLFEAPAFRIHKALEFVVFGKNKNILLVTSEIMMICLESFHNSQKHGIMGLISSLCRNHISRKKNHRVLLPQIIQSQLTKDSTNRIIGYTRLNPDMTF